MRDSNSAIITVNAGNRDSLIDRMDRLIQTRPVLTAFEVNKELTNPEAPQRELRLVVVDDASYVLERVKRNKLMRWIARNGSWNTQIVMLTI